MQRAISILAVALGMTAQAAAQRPPPPRPLPSPAPVSPAPAAETPAEPAPPPSSKLPPEIAPALVPAPEGASEPAAGSDADLSEPSAAPEPAPRPAYSEVPRASDAKQAPDAAASRELPAAGGSGAEETPGAAPDRNWQTPSDHDRVIERLGVGFVGVIGLPFGAPGSGDRVDAPAVGVRYWLDDALGIEAGVGFGFAVTSGSAFAPNVAEMDTTQTGEIGFVLHGGLPISLWDVGHYNALVIPELNVGFSNGIDDPMPDTTLDDTFFNGFLVSLGVRAGAEFHLEFLDLPQATLQLTVGVNLSIERRIAEDDFRVGSDETIVRVGTNVLRPSDLLASGLQFYFYF